MLWGFTEKTDFYVEGGGGVHKKPMYRGELRGEWGGGLIAQLCYVMYSLFKVNA